MVHIAISSLILGLMTTSAMAFNAGSFAMQQHQHRLIAQQSGGGEASSLDAWVGVWTTGIEEEIVIASSGAGGLDIEAYATYGANDAARIDMGAVNTGMFSGSVPAAWIEDGVRLRFVVNGETIAAYDSAANDICAIEMVLEGEALTVTDNRRCGGANVSFTGEYTKAQ